MILLTGITGNIGSATARALLAKGVKFRALARDLDKAAPWAEQGVEVVQGDLDDSASVRAALVGIDRAVLVMPNGEQQERIECAFVQTAKECGLEWIIKLSSPEAVRGTTSPIPLAHIAAEDAIMASGMKWTFVRPSFYMQNFRGAIKGARATGKLSMPMGDGTIELLLKAIDGSTAAMLCDAALGDVVECSGAIGKGFATSSAGGRRRAVLVATGTGISPIRSLLRSGALDGIATTLYYGTSNAAATAESRSRRRASTCAAAAFSISPPRTGAQCRATCDCANACATAPRECALT